MAHFIDKLSEAARFAFRAVRTRRSRVQGPSAPDPSMPDRTVEWVQQSNMRNMRAATRDTGFVADSRGRNIDASDS